MSDPLGLIRNTGASGASYPSKPTGANADAQGGPNFKDVLMKNLDQVNQLQQEAQNAIEDLASGRRADVDSVLIAKQKADLAFQTLLQVRNKMISAYEEIKQIRV